MDIKEFITGYYNALLKPEEVTKYVHPQMVIRWQSSKGYLELEPNDLLNFSKLISKQYTTLRLDVLDVMAEGDKVAVRYASIITSPDNPLEEKELSHSMSMWELKDNKLYRGYVITSDLEKS